MPESEKSVILVTGSNGQLGKELRDLSSQFEQFEFLFTTRDAMDITDSSNVDLIFQKYKPDYCINCAAYTAVDLAQTDIANAYDINERGVKNLTTACQAVQTTLINISTDYVYDSISDRPIVESDSCQPKGVYAQSKRKGEEILEQSDINWINIRVSWLYSSYNKNFVKTMLKLGAVREQLNIVADQVGAPTYAKDLASAILEIIISHPGPDQIGHYNFSNSGKTHWADFAREIFKLTNLECQVSEITTKDFGAPAPRPLWSVMSKEKIQSTFDISLSNWKDSLQECLKTLGNLQH